MQMTNERAEQFKADAAQMNLKAGSASTDTVLQVIGLLLMIAGVVAAVLLAIASKSISDARSIQNNIIWAVAMLCLTVLGLGVFLRYSLGKFMRLWLLRQIYENHSHVDQVVDALSTKR
jgi:membrane protein YqaA with SNARE-associated domain